MQWRSIFKLTLKIALSAVAIYLILRKVDLQEALGLLGQSNPAWIAVAFLSFFTSKVLSAFRINELYRSRELHVPEYLNGKLTFMAMFYNLFVPLVGGEAYKAYWLKTQKGYSAKTTLTAALLDRVAGMVALAVLTSIFFYFTEYAWSYKWALFLSIPILYLGHYIGSKWFFRKFLGAWKGITIYSIGIQFLQVITVYAVILAMGIDEQLIEYIFVFLLATFAFVIPLIGAREMAFVFGSDQLGLNMEISLAIALMFYFSLLFSSLIGMGLFLFEKDLRSQD